MARLVTSHHVRCVEPSPCILAVSSLSNSTARHTRHVKLDWLDAFYTTSATGATRDRVIRRLQAVQNAAARLVTRTRRRDHISPVLLQLHWLPVYQRMKFKLAVFLYESLYGLAPQYMVEDCELVAAADRRQLRSSDIAAFVVPRTNTRLGNRIFHAVTGPRLWNSLPSNIRQSDLTLQQFRWALKTYLFG